MRNKKKEEVSNSDSDTNVNLQSHVKNGVNSKKSNRKKNVSIQKSVNCSGSGSDDCIVKNEINRTQPEANRVSHNEVISGKQPLDTTNHKISSANSTKEKPVSVNAIFTAEELTSDDEIFTFQCPYDFIKQDICKESINFNKSKEIISCNNERYQIELFNSEKKFITLAVPKKISGGSLCNLPLKGHIIVQRVALPTENIKTENVCDENDMAFPNDIKIRHPLLGVEWKTHIDLAHEAIKKENSVRRKKRKILKEEILETEKINSKKIKRESSEPEITFSKKKKKKN